jgi:hypothetical protein
MSGMVTLVTSSPKGRKWHRVIGMTAYREFIARGGHVLKFEPSEILACGFEKRRTGNYGGWNKVEREADAPWPGYACPVCRAWKSESEKEATV